MNLKTNIPIILTALSLAAMPVMLSAQDLERIGSGNAFEINGGLSLTQIAYGVNGIDERRDPYNYFATGNVNINIYGMSIPLAFTYSNQNSSFQQPFNQFGIAPTYKNWRAHLGYNSLTFSPYTLNGHIFLGGGLEYDQEKFHVKAVYGRFQKAVSPDTVNNPGLVPFFERRGYGVQLGYKNKGDFVDLNLFRGRDDENSISFIPEELGLLPEENLVMSLSGGKKIGKFSVTGEYAGSGITRDVRAEENSLEDENVFSYAGPLFTHRNSTEYYNAYRANVSYSSDTYNLGMGYERVDPGYRTHGAYFFNNDLENITFNGSLRLFQGSLNLSANAGTQRNNLEDQEVNTMDRFIGSFNVNYQAGQKLNINGNYSNFTTYTFIRSEFDNINQSSPIVQLDTLDFTQISQSANIATSYTLASDESKMRMVLLNLSYQQATDEQGGVEQNTGSRFINGNITFTQTQFTSGLSLTGSVNYNQSTTMDIETTIFGPTVVLSKSLLQKKINASVSSSWNSTTVNGSRESDVYNLRLGGVYKISKHHNLNMNTIVLSRTGSGEQSRDFTEYTITVGYNYNF